MAAETVEGVVEMYRLEPVKTDHAVKLGKHRVRVGDDIVGMKLKKQLNMVVNLVNINLWI